MDEQQAFQEIAKRLGDRWWRLNNLYYIKDETGQKTLFKPNWAQEAFYGSIWYFNVILKARQLGFSTFIAIYMLDSCLFNENQRCGIIDISLPDAKKKLEKIKYAYKNLPASIKQEVQALRLGAEEVEFSNGSGVVIGTSHRGDTLQKLHISEYGKIAARFPEKAQEIKTGALNAIHSGQQIFVESTAEGQQGEFFELCEIARKLADEGQTLTALDPKFHFYPWWKHPGYMLDEAASVSIDAEMAKYFNSLQAAGISLTAQQKVWYIKKHAIQGDMMKREFPSLPEEAFEASLEGAYFTKQMETVRRSGFIAPLAWEPSLPVHTFWDIADNSDYMAVWFFQHVGHEYRFIRYMQAAGEDYGWFKNQMNTFGYVYGDHYWPHDGQNKTQTPQGLMTKKQIANTFGIAPIKIISRTPDKLASIQKARTILPRCRFCSVNAAQGIRLLDAYRKEWNDKLSVWKDTPRHDEASHCADAFMTFTDGYQGRAAEFTDFTGFQPQAETEYNMFA